MPAKQKINLSLPNLEIGYRERKLGADERYRLENMWLLKKWF